MSELAEVETEAHAWRASTWAPIAVLAGQVLFCVLLNPMGRSAGPQDRLTNFGLGVMFAQPLMCAWGAAWARYPLVWRLPTGFAACFLLTLVMTARDWNLLGMVCLQSMFFAFLVPLVLLRTRYGWSLVTDAGACQTPSIRGNRFSIRYLLLWTTIVAALCAATRYVVGDAHVPNPGDDVWRLPAFFLVFAMLLSPALIGGTWVLAGWRPGILVLPLGLLLVLAATALASLIAANLSGPSPRFDDIFSIFFWFCTGATASTMLPALVLRLAGYSAIRIQAQGLPVQAPASTDA
ncbi:MAG: hypothetical protein KDA37_03820 [Planctomycetales bacterium]|nr:hypothetical protein [Planctomycetales bacterium]